MKLLLGLIASILLVASLAFAHENEQHVMGTVSKVTNSTITVTTTDGKSVDVALTPQTVFTKDGKTITAKEIKEKDHVVIHAKKNGEKLEAASVRIGKAKSMDQMEVHDMKGGMDMGPDKNQQPH
jgi:ABC-type Fe3+-hydroxamate transport system substrate-binding protein